MLTLADRANLIALVDALNGTNAFRAVADELSAMDRAELVSEPALGYYLINAWYRLDNRNEALELAKALRETCKSHGYEREYRRCRNLEGGILLERGDTARAEEAFLEVFHRSVIAGDRHYEAYATLNLGAVEGFRGEWAEAILSLGRAIAAFQRLGATYALAACYQNSGIVFRESGRATLSDEYFQQAYQLYSNSGVDIDLDLAMCEYERALTINALGDPRRAERLTWNALGRIRDASSWRYPAYKHEADARRVLGILLTAQARLGEARVQLDQALELSRKAEVKLLGGEIAEAFARLDAKEGRDDECEVWTQEAIRIYLEIGASARARRLAQQF